MRSTKLSKSVYSSSEADSDIIRIIDEDTEQVLSEIYNILYVDARLGFISCIDLSGNEPTYFTNTYDNLKIEKLKESENEIIFSHKQHKEEMLKEILKNG